MVKYVSKDIICAKMMHCNFRSPEMTVSDFINDELPAADVQPVKHGRWIDCTFYDPYEKSYEQNFEYKCSCCGHMIYNKPNNDNLFCGHCGARMDGDSK